MSEQQEPRPSLLRLTNLVSSSLAGLVGRLVCHPLDTIKARLQASTSKNVTRSGLYNGLGAALIGGVPATCLYLTSYEASKGYFASSPLFASSPFLVYFAAGLSAEAISCLVFVPTDVIKERLQVQTQAQSLSSSSSFPSSSTTTTATAAAAQRQQQQHFQHQYTGSVDAFQTICRREGLLGLYRGYGATMLAYAPFSALFFTTFEMLKPHFASGGSDGGSFWASVQCSAIAGAFASFTTNPLDLAKLRLQVERRQISSSSSSSSSSFTSILKEVYLQSGIRGLYRGAVARVLFHTPNTCITMVCFEETKNALGRRI